VIYFSVGHLCVHHFEVMILEIILLDRDLCLEYIKDMVSFNKLLYLIRICGYFTFSFL
jgi:hypothetical protein